MFPKLLHVLNWKFSVKQYLVVITDTKHSLAAPETSL